MLMVILVPRRMRGQSRSARSAPDAKGLEVVQVVMAGGDDHAEHHPHPEAQRYGTAMSPHSIRF
jgi:hypothetical protein